MSDPVLPPLPRGPHPPPEALLSALKEPVSPGGREALDHAATCADCSEELVHAEAFLRNAPGASAAAWERFRSGASAPRRRLPAWALAAAAAAVLAIGLPLLLRRPAPDVERGSSSAVALVSPRGPLSGPPRTF